MKVLMAESTDLFHDGRVLKEAASLSNADYQVRIFGFRSAKSVIREFPFRLSTMRVISRRWRALRNLSIVMNLCVLNVRVLFEHADYYHAHNVMFLFSMFVSSRLHKGKLIYDCHEVQTEAGRFQGWIERLLIHKPDFIINVSDGRAAHQSRQHGLKRAEIELIHNYPVLPKERLELPSIGETIRLVFCGGFDLRDNRLGDFIRIIADIPNVTLDLIAFGYRDSHHTIQSLIEEFGLHEKVRFLPLVPLPDLIPTLAKYDLAVDMLTNPEGSISKRYPAINKMYEYMAAGLPAICSNMTAFKEELVARNVAISIDPKQPQQAAMEINKLLVDHERIQRMKETCIKLSREQFNWETEGTHLVEIYDRLAGNDKGSDLFFNHF